MKDIYLVFDYLGPNGYIPFIHKKEELGRIMNKELKTIEQASYFPNVKKIITNDVEKKTKEFVNNIYFIIIDDSLKGIPLSEIISQNLENLIRQNDNFNLIYFNHDASMRSFI